MQESIAPAFKVLPQVSVWEKSPPPAMLEIVSEASPVLCSMTVWALALVPSG
jgi:hypothetical protein